MDNKSALAQPSILSVPASNLIPEGFKLVSIPASDSLHSALSKLLAANIYGAPVSSGSSSDNATGAPAWIGFIQLSDVVAYIAALFQQYASTPPATSVPAKVSADAIHAARNYSPEQINEINTALQKTTVQQYFTIHPPRSSAWSLNDTSSLQTIIDALSTRSRVVLLGADGHITGLISRSTLIVYLAKHLEELKKEGGRDAEVLKTKVGEFPRMVEKHKVVTAPWGDSNERAIDAFARMAEAEISHMALVSGEGGHFDLVGNVSVKDIKTVVDVNGGTVHLLEPVAQYINRIRQENLKAVHPAIHAALDDTVEKVIARLGVTKIHRMYVTCGVESNGPERRLVGVVTLGDIIRLFRSK